MIYFYLFIITVFNIIRKTCLMTVKNMSLIYSNALYFEQNCKLKFLLTQELTETNIENIID